MYASAFLKDYRNTLLELAAMERLLEQCGVTGCPTGARTSRFDSMPKGTNDFVSARIQEQEGIEASVLALRQDVYTMSPQFQQLMNMARNYRERCILRQYYQMGRTDAFVAECLAISVRHANRLRKEMLSYFDNTATMSVPVVDCPGQAC